MTAQDDGGPEFLRDHPWIEDGGPAFPLTADTACFKGMTLRDYFAGQALAGYIAHLGAQGHAASRFTEECAMEAYRFADAMLAERSKKP